MTRTKSKIIGLIICVIALLMIPLILYFSSDIRAQKKLLDRWFVALKMDDSEDIADMVTPNFSSDPREWLSGYEKNPAISYRISDRRAVNGEANNLFFVLDIDIRVADNKNIDDKEFNMTVEKVGNKWKVSEFSTVEF